MLEERYHILQLVPGGLTDQAIAQAQGLAAAKIRLRLPRSLTTLLWGATTDRVPTSFIDKCIDLGIVESTVISHHLNDDIKPLII